MTKIKSKTGMSYAETWMHRALDVGTLGLWYVFVHGPRKHHADRVTTTRLPA